MKNLLIIFSKNPSELPVKTRLANEIGSDEARLIYEKILKQTILVNQNKDYGTKIYSLGGTSYYKKFGIEIGLQSDGSLGEKMLDAFTKELQGNEKVLIIGSDLPELDSTDISFAFERLSDYDVVIGPTEDGGYYLVGMKKPSNIFENIPWSTSEVYKKTIECLKNNNLSYYILQKKRDLDTKSDYDYYRGVL